MNKQAFSKIGVLIILVILIGGGVAFWQSWPTLKNKDQPENKEEKVSLKNQIEDWSLYTEIKDNEDKWVGTGFCGNKDFEDVLVKSKSESMKILRLNKALDLVITPNYKNWTNKEFIAFNNDPTAICSAGGRYPQHAYPDKLLWVGSCGTGFSPPTTSSEYKTWKDWNDRCEEAKKAVENFFSKKY